MSVADIGGADVVVSVAMITYNHERFIAQAIESVLMQQTDFTVELVIGEDCSTDNTRAIVRGYADRYPDRIRLLLPEQNLGMMANAAGTYKACRGQYIAVLEGDDYWTSPHKLRKQIEFFNAHPECTICFHNVVEVFEDGGKPPREICSSDQKEISTLADLLADNFIPTCSAMFRREVATMLPDWWLVLGIGDWPLHVLNAHYGDIGYIGEVMAAHRVHSGGVWSASGAEARLRELLKVYHAFSVHLDPSYQPLIGKAAIECSAKALAQLVQAENSVEQSTRCAFEAFERFQAEFPLLRDGRSQVASRVYAAGLYTGHRQRDYSAVRHCFVQLTRWDPSQLRNLGIWSISVEALLGPRATQFLRRALGSVLSPGQRSRQGPLHS